MIDARLSRDDAGFVIWEDGGPVSLAGFGGTTPHGTRIGPVYTPPEHRGRGYGSAVTAAVTAERLAAGRRFCFLYTDLSNPISNRIYVAMGYRRVCDSPSRVLGASSRSAGPSRRSQALECGLRGAVHRWSS